MNAGPIRVTQFASGDLWAGAEVQLHALVTALRAEPAVDVDVVLLNDGLLAARLRADGIAVRVFDEHRLGPVALLRALRQHVAGRRTQVLHSHRYKENLLASAIRFWRPEVRSMRTVHGSPEDVPGLFALRKRLPRWLDWLTARFVQAPVVCVSSQLGAQWRESLPAARLAVIPNGIDVSALRAQAAAHGPASPRGGRLRVGFFGRLTAVKRVDLIISIARHVETSAPGAFEFLLFGDGPLRPELERQVDAESVGTCVRFMGFTSEPAAALAAMDMLLVTSDHEGLPMVVLEAMALGVPVVSHAVGAVPEVLEEGRAGTLVRQQEPGAYAEAILRRRAAAAETRAMVERASHRVLAEYSAARMASRYVATYRSLVSPA